MIVIIVVCYCRELRINLNCLNFINNLCNYLIIYLYYYLYAFYILGIICVFYLNVFGTYKNDVGLILRIFFLL